MHLADDIEIVINDCKRKPEMMKAMVDAMRASLNGELISCSNNEFLQSLNNEPKEVIFDENMIRKVKEEYIKRAERSDIYAVR